jgi:hypothetical protein
MSEVVPNINLEEVSFTVIRGLNISSKQLSDIRTLQLASTAIDHPELPNDALRNYVAATIKTVVRPEEPASHYDHQRRQRLAWPISIMALHKGAIIAHLPTAEVHTSELPSRKTLRDLLTAPRRQPEQARTEQPAHTIWAGIIAMSEALRALQADMTAHEQSPVSVMIDAAAHIYERTIIARGYASQNHLRTELIRGGFEQTPYGLYDDSLAHPPSHKEWLRLYKASALEIIPAVARLDDPTELYERGFSAWNSFRARARVDSNVTESHTA